MIIIGKARWGDRGLTRRRSHHCHAATAASKKWHSQLSILHTPSDNIAHSEWCQTNIALVFISGDEVLLVATRSGVRCSIVHNFQTINGNFSFWSAPRIVRVVDNQTNEQCLLNIQLSLFVLDHGYGIGLCASGGSDTLVDYILLQVGIGGVW